MRMTHKTFIPMYGLNVKFMTTAQVNMLLATTIVMALLIFLSKLI